MKENIDIELEAEQAANIFDFLASETRDLTEMPPVKLAQILLLIDEIINLVNDHELTLPPGALKLVDNLKHKVIVKVANEPS